MRPPSVSRGVSWRRSPGFLGHDVLGRMEETMKCLDELYELTDWEAKPPCEKLAEDFELDLFWVDVVGTVGRISHNVMKANVLYKKPPIPNREESVCLWNDIEKQCVLFTALCRSFPAVYGLTLKTQVRGHLCGIISAVRKFVQDLFTNVTIGNELQPEATALVIELCDKLKDQCRDNKSAVLTLIKEQLELAKDCVREFGETIEEMQEDLGEADDEDDELGLPHPWCSREVDLAKGTLGLIKTSYNCLKKTSEFITAYPLSEFGTDLEVMAEYGGDVSRHLDDLVAELYPAMHVGNVVADATLLSQHMKSLLAASRRCPCFTDTDKVWNDFLLKALDHNLTNVENLSLKSRLG